jgi:undecaprenyl diphosphate synthase
MGATPQCIGIILDGNRRWAKEKGLPTLEGHRVGLLTTLKDTVTWVRDAGVKHLAVFMFSTENWSRAEAEVTYLMELFREAGRTQMKELGKENVRIRFAGQRERFAPDLQKLMDEVEQETAHNTGITLWTCLSYGGRAEIAAAAAAAQKAGEEITEEVITKHLWTAEMPEPDIIIRTSGEQRLSGFLTWKGVYSELFFIDTKWPDFSKEILQKILEEYAERERRHGK